MGQVKAAALGALLPPLPVLVSPASFDGIGINRHSGLARALYCKVPLLPRPGPLDLSPRFPYCYWRYCLDHAGYL